VILIRGAEIEGHLGNDVRCNDGEIVAIGKGLVPTPGEVTIDADGGALLPGLHDHHIHLFALAAARRSVECGPPQVTTREGLRDVLENYPDDEGELSWIRGVGYHESIDGMLDRWKLDALIDHRPVRIQHRSGKMWFLNSAAVFAVGLGKGSNGQLFRQDDWLRGRVEFEVDLADVSRLLASYGVTGITDATPSNDAMTEMRFRENGVSQRVTLMGGDTLPAGPLKIMLDDYALPEIDVLRDRIVAAHQSARPVAFHCVTRTELIFALSVLMEAGCLLGDRIEHASITDSSAMNLLLDARVTVVTQPNLITERGDQYLVDVKASDHSFLYRCRGFLHAGVPLGGGTDAPYGQPDPWAAMRAAVTRETAGGRIIGARESLTPEQALALFTTLSDDPGGPPRRIAVGEPADLCLLDCPWSSARSSLINDHVAATVVDGVPIYQRR
jgi:predicted amidohydrolase YtcJ